MRPGLNSRSLFRPGCLLRRKPEKAQTGSGFTSDIACRKYLQAQWEATIRVPDRGEREASKFVLSHD